MLNTMKKKLAAVAILTAIALPASASLATFTDAPEGGTGAGVSSISFDEMTVTTQGDSVITQTFVDGINDPFVELGLTGVTSFKKGGAGVASFIGAPAPFGFELIFDISLAGTAATTDLGGGVFDVDVSFGNTSVASLYYGDDMDNGIGGDVKIADLTLTTGTCDLTIDTGDINSDNEGTCNVTFNLDAVSGWFSTSWGEDFADLLVMPTIDFALDIDVKNFTPGSINNPNTIIHVAHDGSAVINVPEPTTIAILGLGLLGLAGTRRKS